MEFVNLSESVARSAKTPSAPTFAKQCEAGRVPGAEKIGGRWCVSPEDLCKKLQAVELAELISPNLGRSQEAPSKTWQTFQRLNSKGSRRKFARRWMF